MTSILDLVQQQLGGDTVRQLSHQLGADQGATAKAVSGALPMLLGALAKNASTRGGAEALTGALARDHDGSVLDHVAGFLGQGSTGTGDGILRHVLGERRGSMAGALGRMSGLDSASAGRLLAMVAPLVLGALGQARKRGNLSASGVADLLAGERRQVERAAPEAMGLFGQILDADGDGQVLDDLAGHGASLLSSFLGGRR